LRTLQQRRTPRPYVSIESSRPAVLQLRKQGANVEMTALEPMPELPDDTLISRVRFPTRIANALREAGVSTVGEIRETPDADLLRFQDLGKGSIAFLRKTLGLPSSGGVRPDK
jgi:DNA-directed RNA polymerase alpha subunit